MKITTLVKLLTVVSMLALMIIGTHATSDVAHTPVPDLSTPPLNTLHNTDDDTLIQWLNDDKRPIYRSLAAINIGKRHIARAAPALRRLLTDKVRVVRMEAAGALLQLGDESGLSLLRELLKSKVSATRAAELLAAYGDDSGLDYARQQLQSQSVMQRLAAIQTLAASRDDVTAYAAIRAGVLDTDPHIRALAISLAEKRGEKESVEILRLALSSEDRQTRGLAVKALGGVRLSDAIPVLLESLAHQDSNVKIGAAVQLNLLTGQSRSPLAALKPEGAKKLEREWREWWEANKSKYPSGTRLSTSPPALTK